MLDVRSNTEQIAQHYARYVEELREFLKSAGLPFGSPEHLSALTKRLREDEVFREEMYSMNRSIIFREGGALPPTELLRLLAAAVGGAAVDEQAEQHRPEIRYLLQFLTSVTRAPVNQPRGGTSRQAAAQTAPVAPPIASGPDFRRTSARWSGKPSAPALRWAEIWNGATIAGARRLLESERRWWIPALVAALASVSLLLWLPHSRVPPPVVHQSIAPVVASSPQVAAEPQALTEPDPVDNRLTPPCPASHRGPQPSEAEKGFGRRPQAGRSKIPPGTAAACRLGSTTKRARKAETAPGCSYSCFRSRRSWQASRQANARGTLAFSILSIRRERSSNRQRRAQPARCTFTQPASSWCAGCFLRGHDDQSDFGSCPEVPQAGERHASSRHRHPSGGHRQEWAGKGDLCP